MKKFTIALFLVGVMMPAIIHAQTIYLSENFDSPGWPAGWTTINNDGLTPNANVSNYTDAWIKIENFDNTGIGDSVAASTSWYTPPGISDDYLITPQIAIGSNAGVFWEVKAQDPSFPDGYQLRISTTTPDVAGFLANPPLYSIPAAAPAWTSLNINLGAAGYANQSIYLAWRNISNDQFLLLVDDIVVKDLAAFDVGVISVVRPDPEYTQIPIHQSPVFTLGGTIENLGSTAVTNARLTVDIKRNGTLVYSDTTAGVSIAPGQTSTASFPTYSPTDTGSYTVEYHASIAESDVDASNDDLSSSIIISETVFARDNGVQTGSLGIGPGTPGELGQNFTFTNLANINSISLFLVNGNDVMLNQPVSAKIYFFANEPNSVVANTDTVVVTQSGPHWIDLPVAGGPITLPPGVFSFLAQEGDSNLTIGTTPTIFTPGAGWVTFPGNPLGTWANSEDFGFQVAYMLRVNTSKFCSLSAVLNNVTENTCPGDLNGAINITPSAGTPPYAFSWSNGDTTEDISGLGVGDYIGTITDSEGCEYVLPTVTISSTDTLPDGEITFNITGGDVGFYANSTNATTYSWDFGDSSDVQTVPHPVHTYANNGSYTVTLTMTNNCGTTTLVNDSVIVETVGLEDDLQKNITIAPNPNQGVFNLNFENLKLQDVQIEIFTMAGQKVHHERLDPVLHSYSHPVNLAGNLAKGIYILEITTDKVKIRKRFNLE
ncbi:MAG: choice-of-anchor J domain-containing protein [Bacteroidia bacterium]